MKLQRLTLLVVLFLVIIFFNPMLNAQTTTEIIKPEKHFGFKPGTDRMLFTYEELITYLQKLDSLSPRLKLVEIGKSPINRKIYIAFISSEENLKKLQELKEINRRLALDPDIPKRERDLLIEKGKIFFLATLSMHSNEVGPSQAAPLIAYEWISTQDP